MEAWEEDMPSIPAAEFRDWREEFSSDLDSNLRTFQSSLRHFLMQVTAFEEDLPSIPSAFQSRLLDPATEDESSPSAHSANKRPMNSSKINKNHRVFL